MFTFLLIAGYLGYWGGKLQDYLRKRNEKMDIRDKLGLLDSSQSIGTRGNRERKSIRNTTYNSDAKVMSSVSQGSDDSPKSVTHGVSVDRDQPQVRALDKKNQYATNAGRLRRGIALFGDVKSALNRSPLIASSIDYFLLIIDGKNLRSAKHREFRQLIPLAKPNDIVFIATVGEGGGIISPGIPFSDLMQQEIGWPDSLGEPDSKDMDYISELYFRFSAIAESAQLHWIILVDVDKFSQLIEDVRSSFNVKWSSVSVHLDKKNHTLLKSQYESSEEIKRKLSGSLFSVPKHD